MPRILVVEDDKHIRRILESLFKHEGLDVLTAGDGSDALTLLDEGPFALIITDLLMPRMDGFQFVRELRKHPNGNAPLIVTSAIYRDAPAQLRLQSELGPHQFFAKPFQVPEMLAAVRKLLGHAPARMTGPIPVAEAPQQGTLAERSPPSLLLEAYENKLTGAVTFLRGKVRKQIAFLHGAPINVDSNLRTETLGNFLVSRGLIDETRHQAALTRAQRVHEKLGRALLELGWITEKDLLRELVAQMRAKIATTLRWNDGEWTIVDGEPPGDRLQTPMEAPRIVFRGLQKTAHVDEIAQRLAAARGHLTPLPRAAQHREAFVRVFGSAAIDALQRRPLVEELMAGADPAAMLTALDALLLCGLAQLEQAEAAPSPPPERGDPVALARITVGPPRANAITQKNLYDELFGSDEISAVHSLPLEPARAPVEPARESSEAREALRKEILAEYLELPSRDCYRVLGVARDAGLDAIRAAFQAKKIQFAVERFSDVDLGRDYGHLESLHQAFHRALDTLTSPLRPEYDRTLEGENALPRTIDAELLAGEAAALLSKGDVKSARAKLHQAVTAAPDEAAYRGQLGWALYLDGDTVNAWVQIEQALTIDPDDVDAHVLAGGIAAASGDDARAVQHLEKALETNPPRSDALSLLEEVQTRRDDLKRLERTYRKLIHRLGDPQKTIPLWFKLAALYDQMGDAESSKVAWQVCARLAPNDPRVKKAPGLDDAFRDYVAAQHWDAALVTASVIVARGGAGEPADFHRRFRPRFLQRAQAPFTASALAQLVVPGEKLPNGAAPPVEELPPLLTRVLLYVRWLLGDAAPALPLDPSLLSVENPVELGFLVGRALFPGAPRTGERIGLVVCGDLTVAARLAREPEPLVDFALSEPYLSLRAALGLSVEV